MRDRFQDRAVLVTGVTGGLGCNLAHAFAAEGAHVAVTARREAKGQVLAEEIGRGAMFAPLDVADEASWVQATAMIEQRLGPIAILVNNAAHIAISGVEDVPIGEWCKVLDANLTGPFLGIRAVAPPHAAEAVDQSSTSPRSPVCTSPPAWRPMGQASGGLRSLTRTAFYGLARDNIRVNAVHPGIVDTPLAYDPTSGDELVPVSGFAIPRMASAEEIARYVLFVASDAAGFSTGSEFVADGGYALGPIATSPGAAGADR